MDLEAGGLLHEAADPVETSNRIVTRYHDLWQELTGQERFEKGDRWRVDARIRGSTSSASTSTSSRSRPTSAGPRSRSSPRSSTRATTRAACCASPVSTSRRTSAPPAQRPRLLPRLAGPAERGRGDRARLARQGVRADHPQGPRSTAKLEPEVFHEVLEHRWYMSEKAGRRRPDRGRHRGLRRDLCCSGSRTKSVLGVDTVEMPVVAMFGDELGGR